MAALRIFASACWSRGRPLGKFIYVIDFFKSLRMELKRFATQCIVYAKSRFW
jgi:hypothetical protein